MLDKFIQFISLFFFAIAIWLVGKEIEHIGWVSLKEVLLKTPPSVFCWSILMTGINYIILSGYDVLSFEYINKKLPYKDILKISSLGFAVSNTSGHAYASGGAVRYLFYLPLGISRLDILKVIVFESLTILLGIILTYIISIGILPFETEIIDVKYKNILYFSASCLLILLICYVFFCGDRQQQIKIKKMRIPFPSYLMTLKQFMIGLCDNITLFLTFYILLSFHIDCPLIETFVIFIIAQCLGFATQVPGGLGVFEGTFLYLYPHSGTEKAGIIASLILFRLIYYFLPLILSGFYFGIYWVKKNFKN